MYPNIIVSLLKWYMQCKSSNVKGYDKIDYVLQDEVRRMISRFNIAAFLAVALYSVSGYL